MLFYPPTSLIHPAEATDDQIKVATGNKVTFTSTSKMQVYNIGRSESNACDDNKECLTVKYDQNNRNYEENKATIGVNFDGLKNVYLNTKQFKKENNATADTVLGNWACVYVTLFNVKPSADLQQTVKIENSDMLLDTVTSATSDQGCVVRLWINIGDKEETKTGTLIYHDTTGYEEKLTLTLDIKNAVDLKILSAKAATPEDANGLETNSNGIIVDNKVKYSPNGVTEKAVCTVNVDTYKYGMKTTEMLAQTDKTTTKTVSGRWYALVLETNVPVDNLQINNSWGATTQPGSATEETNTVWIDVPEEAKLDDNHLIVWINRDATEEEKNVNSVQQTLINKYTDKGVDGNASKHQVGIDIIAEEKSKTALHHEVDTSDQTSDVWETSIKNEISEKELESLKDIRIETIHEDAKRQAEDKKSNYGTFAYTLAESKNMKITNSVKDGINTANIQLNSGDVSEVALTHNKNIIKGKWILVHFAVRGDAGTIIDKTNSDAVIVDTDNRGELLSSQTTSKNTVRIPLWINLDNADIQKATRHAGETAEPTPFKVTFGSSSPVEEENYFYLTIDDTNYNTEEIPTSAVPKGIDVSQFDEDTVTQRNDGNKIAEQLFPEDAEETKKHLNNDNVIKAFVHNQNELSKFNISKEIVGDTVYMTIKGDYSKLKTTTNTDYKTTGDFNVAFDLDLSSIIESDKGYCYNDGTKSWVEAKVDNNKHCHFGLTIYNSYVSICNETGLTKEYIFCSTNGSEAGTDCSKLKGKYIRYVFTFINEN